MEGQRLGHTRKLGLQMPYEFVEQLPSKVRRAIPYPAQKIFLKAWNEAFYEYNCKEPVCFAIAWTAIKDAGYSKNIETGKWEKK